MNDAATVPDRRGDDRRFIAITKRIDDIAGEVQKNTEITQRIESSTSGLVEAWEAISGGLKVLNFLGKIAKWVAVVAGAFTAAASAVYIFTHGGGPTP